MTKSPLEKYYGRRRCLALPAADENTSIGDIYMVEGLVLHSDNWSYYHTLHLDSWDGTMVDFGDSCPVGTRIKVFGIVRRHWTPDMRVSQSFEFALQIIKVKVLAVYYSVFTVQIYGMELKFLIRTDCP